MYDKVLRTLPNKCSKTLIAFLHCYWGLLLLEQHLLWKLAMFIKGDRLLPRNYCSVSFISNCCKVMKSMLTLLKPLILFLKQGSFEDWILWLLFVCIKLFLSNRLHLYIFVNPTTFHQWCPSRISTSGSISYLYQLSFWSPGVTCASNFFADDIKLYFAHSSGHTLFIVCNSWI